MLIYRGVHLSVQSSFVFGNFVEAHKTVCHAKGEYARDDDEDSKHEVHTCLKPYSKKILEILKIYTCLPNNPYEQSIINRLLVRYFVCPNSRIKYLHTNQYNFAYLLQHNNALFFGYELYERVRDSNYYANLSL